MRLYPTARKISWNDPASTAPDKGGVCRLSRQNWEFRRGAGENEPHERRRRLQHPNHASEDTPISVTLLRITVLIQDRPSTRRIHLPSIVDCRGRWCKYYLTDGVA